MCGFYRAYVLKKEKNRHIRLIKRTYVRIM